jgi:putative oxygen-independent coproporphyrinogen III oxidase
VSTPSESPSPPRRGGQGCGEQVSNTARDPHHPLTLGIFPSGPEREEVGFGIYVHWPFCAAKCPYCDFNSHVRSQIDESAWVSGIVRELRYVAGLQGGGRPPVQTIFFGGGTPSLMEAGSVAAVLDAIAELWPVARDVEVTLESNPASADAERFRDYRVAGVNRLSLGVQALNDADLKALGRLHDVAEAKAALALAMRNFERVSLDLIYARPHQTAAQWRDELREALAFGTEHLSLYQLTVEPATPFATLARTGALTVPDDDTAAALYETTQEMTEAAGVPVYEISNHARPGAECRHNLLYWQYDDYAGVGPGAHGRLTLKGRRIATSTERLPERWHAAVERQGHGFVDQSEIAAQDAAREHLLMNLRLTKGINLVAYESRWDVQLERARIDALAANGLLTVNDLWLAATLRGRLVLNSVIAALTN